MPKKMGVNSKAEAARDRRSAAEADRRDRQERAKEEHYWAEGSDGGHVCGGGAGQAAVGQ
uniref:Uncharacterized protein n=1 Tax=Zea mays TaxID=4577 RepID=B6UD00_MAIZE|nr:hypothetical protein [Zea mays]